MFQLGKTIVSEDILEKEFVCNLSACKGACCVDGDAGAPLNEAETKILEEIFPKIKPFLRKEGIAAIEAQGTWTKGTDGDLETPLIENKDCAYVIFDGKTALCGIEQAYNQGEVSFKKPVSCHLYPIRVKDFTEFFAVNYDKWEICDAACSLGKELEVPVTIWRRLVFRTRKSSRRFEKINPILQYQRLNVFNYIIDFQYIMLFVKNILQLGDVAD